MREIKLNDNWEVSGIDFDEFVEIINELGKMTKCRKVSTAEMELLLSGYESRNFANTIRLTPELIKVLDEHLVDMITGSFDPDEMELPVLEQKIESEYDHDLYRETFRESGFMMKEKEKCFYISRNALPSLFSRLKLGGEKMYNTNIVRNLLVGKMLYEQGIQAEDRAVFKNPEDTNASIVYRELKDGEKTLRKIFFVPTNKYCPIPLMVLPEIAEKICDDDILGDPDIQYWRVNHDIAEIVITFPAIAEETASAYTKLPDEVLPGVLIRTSDTGKSCVDVKAVAFVGRSHHYITLETSKRKHTGEVTSDEIVNEANEVVLRNVRVLPELLANLTENVIYEPGVTKDVSVVRKAISKTILYCGLTKVLGKKREKDLKTGLFAEINEERVYTQYDIAAMIMKISDRIAEIPQYMRDQLGEACAKAPFAFKEADEEELYLMPEE